MKNKEILLPNKKYFKAPDEDVDIRLDLDVNQNLLRENDRNIILDIAKLYDKERNDSKNYKIYGKLRMIFRNMYSGSTPYSYLQERLYLNGDGSNGDFTGYLPYNEFSFLRNDVLRELNLPTSGSNLGTFTQNIVLTGNTSHTTITSITAPYHNWNLYLSYVYSGDTTFPMKYTLSGNTTYSFTAGDGIPFRVTDNGKYYKLTSPVEHGMVSGEYIIISGGTLTNSVPTSGRTFNIESVGDEIYDSEKYVINLLKNQFTSSTTLSSVIIGKRCKDINNITGTTSKYYVHKHKTLTNSNDYIMDKVGFELPIFEEERKLVFENSAGVNDVLVERNRMESVLFDFKENFVLTGLTNNLGYTPTEVYVSMILKNNNGYFNYPPKVGYKFHFHNSWVDNHFSGTTSNETNLSGGTFTRSGITFTSGTTVPIGTTLTGAFVEYNEHEMKERIISESFHKFTSPKTIFNYGQDDPLVYSGTSINNMIGLYYQPHYRVKLRELSPYIETSKTNDVYNIPDNTKYFEDEGLWKWRDLYDHGFIDPDGNGTDFPFVNNTHYVKTNIDFLLRNEKNYTNKTDGVSKIKKIDC